MIAGDALGAMTFTGIFVGGLNRQTYFANAACRVETFFMTPALSTQDDRVIFLPLCYADILGHLRRTQIDAELFSVAPPAANGICRFRPLADFLPEPRPYLAVRIAHNNGRT